MDGDHQLNFPSVQNPVLLFQGEPVEHHYENYHHQVDDKPHVRLIEIRSVNVAVLQHDSFRLIPVVEVFGIVRVNGRKHKRQVAQLKVFVLSRSELKESIEREGFSEN